MSRSSMAFTLVTLLCVTSVCQDNAPQYPFSPKLQAYIRKVELETNRKLRIERTSGGETPVFSRHATELLVIVPHKFDLTKQTMERSIAHEITHGRVIYGRGYCYLDRTVLSTPDIDDEAMWMNMLDDLVVNKIIQEEGFEPYPIEYLPQLARETADAKKGLDTWARKGFRPAVAFKFKTYRYLLTWGLLKYFRLERGAKQVMHEYLAAQEKAHPAESKVARRIAAAVSKHNIFKAEGHRKILDDQLEIWQLQGVLRVRCDE